MSRSSALIVLGLLVILVPFLGLPSSISTLLAVVLGALVLGIGLVLRAREAHRAAPAPVPEPASPSMPPPELPLVS